MLYFAYGANLSKDLIQERCPGVKPVAAAQLKDFELRFVGHSTRWNGGVSTIAPAPGRVVFGALYEISHEHEMALDEVEGVPTFYSKDVVVIDGKPALVYVCRVTRPAPPSKAYIDAIRQGYVDWGHPVAKLDVIETRDGDCNQ
ncbi:gamma-glutamylcyclotransferase [bacterium]|nr:gamma-glutamylcyclotransferase [bacterium]